MKTKDFDILTDDILLEETKKLIQEQIDRTNEIIDKIRQFKSLTGFGEKVEVIDDGGTATVINVKDITPEDLIKCCGGDSFGKAQTNLMQGLHNDLEECGFPGNDIDIDAQGDENLLGLIIRITPNDDELSKENDIDMNEQTDNGELSNSFGQPMYEEEPKDTNPTAKDDKDLVLGGEMDEQAQDASGAMSAQVGEHHKHDKASQIAFICKNDKKAKKEDLEKLSPKEVEKKYIALEKKMGLYENKKKVVRLSEAQMGALVEKIIKEAKIETPNLRVPANGVPGLDVTNKNRKDSGRENAEALKAVEKKIKDLLSFEGNTDPEFPDQVGKGEEKVATKNTDSEDEVVALNRGRNMADLDYDNEPGKEFRERAKLSLVGAAKMGNSSEYANAIPSDVGKNVADQAEKRLEARRKEPIYDKESVPVKQDADKTVRPQVNDEAVAGDIKRIKQMSNYNEKTQ
jgi:hypothetical protein